MPPPEVIDGQQSSQGKILPALSAHDELASYTLLPPSERLDLRAVGEPFSPFIKQLITLNGYEPLVREKRTKHEVLLRVDGWQPSLQALRRAVNDDGNTRHLHWDIENRSKGIRELLLPKRNTSGDSEDDSVGDTLNEVVNDSNDSNQVWKRWIVSFWKEDEARRFVSAWHRRDLAPLLKTRERLPLPDDEQVIINAELIW